MDNYSHKREVNPFNVTKAVDFSDEEIAATWVDLAEDGGFFELVNPRSPMPKFIVGAKGIGRTHIMRFYSAALQAQRYRSNANQHVASDGYIGVYFRASGLNSGRFHGKGVDEDSWSSVFMYYVDLWLAQHALSAVSETCGADIGSKELSARIVKGILDLFDEPLSDNDVSTFGDLSALLRNLQRSLDIEINNAALTHRIDVRIRATPGRLVFGLPAVFAQAVPALESVQFLYLIDEMENFTERQQRYLNTLIREKVRPSSFVIGARLYGIRTRETTTGEENKEGSEFESILLDRMYLKESTRYRAFCRQMISQRLIEAGHREVVREELAGRLNHFFFEHTKESETQFAVGGDRIRERDPINMLASRLESTRTSLSAAQIKEILEHLRFPGQLLLEKMNTFIFFQEWSRGSALVEAARRIGEEADLYHQGLGRTSSYATRMKHFRGDMLAQLLRDYEQPQRYLGIDSFIRMSGGSPRLLLVTLKHVFRWAVFLGQTPFETREPVSEEAQRSGVTEAAKWFLSDSPSVGDRGRLAQDAINRLGSFFRALRFTDKPVESSLASFSVDETALSLTARRVLTACQEFAFLLAAPVGQRDRNTAGVTLKLQLHPMLCPLWDLPIVRRGVTPLTTSEANALFDPDKTGQLQDITSKRLKRMNFPFGRSLDAPQRGLPEL
jgi:hypothetical protein